MRLFLVRSQQVQRGRWRGNKSKLAKFVRVLSDRRCSIFTDRVTRERFMLQKLGLMGTQCQTGRLWVQVP